MHHERPGLRGLRGTSHALLLKNSNPRFSNLGGLCPLDMGISGRLFCSTMERRLNLYRRLFTTGHSL